MLHEDCTVKWCYVKDNDYEHDTPAKLRAALAKAKAARKKEIKELLALHAKLYTAADALRNALEDHDGETAFYIDDEGEMDHVLSGIDGLEHAIIKGTD